MYSCRSEWCAIALTFHAIRGLCGDQHLLLLANGEERYSCGVSLRQIASACVLDAGHYDAVQVLIAFGGASHSVRQRPRLVPIELHTSCKKCWIMLSKKSTRAVAPRRSVATGKADPAGRFCSLHCPLQCTVRVHRDVFLNFLRFYTF